jgi:hypothetical protein
MTLTQFLLARIAEDEAVARAAINPDQPGTHWQWVRDDDDVVVAAPTWEDMNVSLRTVEEYPTSYVGDLPAFVLNSVEAAEPRAMPLIARHDPARVLAECEAKRWIMELHPIYRGPRIQDVGLGTDFGCETCHALDRVHGGSLIEALGYCDTLLALASVYSDHPDFREEWRA